MLIKIPYFESDVDVELLEGESRAQSVRDLFESSGSKSTKCAR